MGSSYTYNSSIPRLRGAKTQNEDSGEPTRSPRLRFQCAHLSILGWLHRAIKRRKNIASSSTTEVQVGFILYDSSVELGLEVCREDSSSLSSA